MSVVAVCIIDQSSQIASSCHVHLRRFYQSRVEQRVQISELLDVQLHLGWLLALTTRHDKEGYCKVSAQDVPFIAHCAHEYTLVFTKVCNLVFLAFYMQSADEPSRTSIVDVYA